MRKGVILTNVTLKSEDAAISLTVGRSTTLLATNLLSTNIVNNASPLILPSGTYNYYIASIHTKNNVNTNLSGSALDQPGIGSFYYTIWMQSNKVGTFREMAAALIVLRVA